MAAKKKTAPVEEVAVTEEIKDDIAVVSEDDIETYGYEIPKDKVTSIAPETTEEPEEKIEENKDELKDSLSKLVDSITNSIKNAPPKQPKAEKKTFKLGFWGYLGLAVVAKAAVEITKAIADSKRPRR